MELVSLLAGEGDRHSTIEKYKEGRVTLVLREGYPQHTHFFFFTRRVCKAGKVNLALR